MHSSNPQPTTQTTAVHTHSAAHCDDVPKDLLSPGTPRKADEENLQALDELMNVFHGAEDAPESLLGVDAMSFRIAEVVSLAPTLATTEAPSFSPTQAPTASPTEAPTVAPTQTPTQAPTVAPTEAPTVAPTQAPTIATQAPT
eukprot:scaffold4256_cov174-Ochromonas_danica.AAC.7